MGYCLLHADGFYHNLNICDIQWFHAFSIIYFTNNSVMKKVFHKLRDYVLALLTLMAMSACSESLNTLGNSHFTKEGELIKKPSFAKLDYNSVIHFYIESSGSMNGFFRAGQPTGFKQDVYEVMSYYAGLTKDINIMTNDGSVAGQLSLAQFQTAMNTGALECNASTQVPVMLQNIVSRLKKNDVAVLISDMKYSPVGSAAPEVLLTQYAADVARIAGNSKKAYSLICAISDYINNFIHIVFNGSGTSCVHNSSGPIKHLLKDILEGKCLHRLTFFKQTIKFSVPSIIPSDTVKGRKFLLDLQIQNGTLL